MIIPRTNRSKEFKIAPWISATRPKTLPAGIAPVILGAALAFHVGMFQWIPAILCLVFSILVQIACNYANDYYDHINGVDTKERIGFTRMVNSGQIAPTTMKIAVFIVLSIAFIVGCGLIPYGGWWLVGIGVISILCAVLYTGGPFPIAYYGFGDLFVFIFYGLVAVMVTYYVQVNHFSYSAFWVAAACGLLAANIRLVNDTRDKQTDAKAGKKTLAVRFGYRYCHTQFFICNLIALIIPFLLVFEMGFSSWTLLPLILVGVSLRIILNFIKAKTGPEYNKLLAESAKFLLAYSVLLSLGICLTRWS